MSKYKVEDLIVVYTTRNSKPDILRINKITEYEYHFTTLLDNSRIEDPVGAAFITTLDEINIEYSIIKSVRYANDVEKLLYV